MKEITFTVPCYNSENYMRRCIESLLVCGDRAEIIVVDDGSTDRTGEIADEYEWRYPDIVKAIHKENGGHGSGVNAGLKAASGTYFKVVDSDDWLDEEALLKALDFLKRTDFAGGPVDLAICNYVYDHEVEKKQKIMDYRNVFESEKVCTWEDMGRFRPSQFLIMHALIFRTELLKKSRIKLPEHLFYVDNLLACQPLPYAERLCYLDVDLYHYVLGREDQSVNEEVYKQRIDQQLRVTKLVADCADLEQVGRRYPRLKEYMARNISIMVTISSVFLLLINDENSLEKREELWDYIKKRNPALYTRLRYRSISGLTKLPGKTGRRITLTGYRVARRFYHFN